MNYAHRFAHRPDDADPPIFFDYDGVWTTKAQLMVGGRLLEVELIVDLVGTYEGTGLLPKGQIKVVGRNGGRRLVDAPLCSDVSRLKLKGFTGLLTAAVNTYLCAHWGEIETSVMEGMM